MYRLPSSPDCREGKHRACDETAWDDETDEGCMCGCDCHTIRTSGCRDCGCPDRSDDHLREEWSCGCRCHTDRTDGSGDAQA